MKILYKPVGVTSNEFIALLKQDKILQNKACYCGRLDPMARGKMLILEGSECKMMPNYLNKDKLYEFEIILGISTDTDDYLGIFNNIDLDINNIDKISKSSIQQCLDKLSLNELQKFHRYSSYILNKDGLRKPLWEWEKLKMLENSDIPEKKVKIYDIQFLDEKLYTKNYLISKLITLISKINDRHNFRQKIIKKQWENLLESDDKFFFKAFKVRAHVSSGFYIRQLIYDLKSNIQFPMFVYDINRIGI